jgi:hypothetical protein
MIRLLLTWIGVAALQLAAPPSSSAAELLQPAGERTSVVPRTQAPAPGALSRDGPRQGLLQVTHVTPFAPAALPRALRALARPLSPIDASRRSAPASLPRVLPDARAPPA